MSRITSQPQVNLHLTISISSSSRLVRQLCTSCCEFVANKRCFTEVVNTGEVSGHLELATEHTAVRYITAAIYFPFYNRLQITQGTFSGSSNTPFAVSRALSVAGSVNYLMIRFYSFADMYTTESLPLLLVSILASQPTANSRHMLT